MLRSNRKKEEQLETTFREMGYQKNHIKKKKIKWMSFELAVVSDHSLAHGL